MKLLSCVYDYDVNSDTLFLILKRNGYLAASFYRLRVPEKQKLIKTNSQTDQVTWVDREKSYERTTTKIEVSFIGKKVLYFRPNKAGLFEGSFSWGGGQFGPPSYFKKNLSSISITL